MERNLPSVPAVVSEVVVVYNIGYLANSFCVFFSSQDGRPAVIVLDQLNCLASLADMFDFSVLEKDRNW